MGGAKAEERHSSFALERLSGAALGGATPTPGARLRALLAMERGDLLVLTLYAVFIGLLGLATPVAAQALINTVAFATLRQPLIVLATLLAIGLSFSAVLLGLQTLLVELLSRRVFLRVTEDFAARLPRVRHQSLPGRGAGELVNRFFDVVTIEKAASTLLFDGLAAALQIATGLTLLAVYHPLLLVFDLALVFGLLAVGLVLGRGAIAAAITKSKWKYKVADWLETVARHPALFQTTSGARWAEAHGQEVAAGWLEARRRYFRILLRQIAGLLAIQVAVSVGLLVIGGLLVMDGQLSLGQLVAAEIVLAATVTSIAKISKLIGKFYDLLAAVDKIGVVLDLPLERAGGRTLAPHDGPLSVRLRGLRLCGADGEAREVLNLDLPPGAQVALLGGPGVGRRRLLDALRGLREPLSGSIELGGVDLRDLDVLGLREVCALVGGVEVLADTVHANVALGRALDKAQVRDLLEQVGLGGLINRLPRGTETALTCDGEPLERVELILLNLARAIAGRPRLLLIDRALDALPPAARRLVLRLLLAQDAAWTLIVATDLDDVAAALPRAVRVGAPASKALTATGTPLLEAQ